jgi:hypothetical protein
MPSLAPCIFLLACFFSPDCLARRLTAHLEFSFILQNLSDGSFFCAQTGGRCSTRLSPAWGPSFTRERRRGGGRTREYSRTGGRGRAC